MRGRVSRDASARVAGAWLMVATLLCGAASAAGYAVSATTPGNTPGNTPGISQAREVVPPPDDRGELLYEASALPMRTPAAVAAPPRAALPLEPHRPRQARQPISPETVRPDPARRETTREQGHAVSPKRPMSTAVGSKPLTRAKQSASASVITPPAIKPQTNSRQASIASTRAAVSQRQKEPRSPHEQIERQTRVKGSAPRQTESGRVDRRGAAMNPRTQPSPGVARKSTSVASRSVRPAVATPRRGKITATAPRSHSGSRPQTSVQTEVGRARTSTHVSRETASRAESKQKSKKEPRSGTQKGVRSSAR